MSDLIKNSITGTLTFHKHNMEKKIIIAIDGPAGSGKSSSAKIVAEALNYTYIDTGAMYRAVTLGWIEQRKEYNESEIIKLMDDIQILLKASPQGQRTFLNGKDVSEEIRTGEVTKLVSPVSAIPDVREKLVDMQRKMGNNSGIVMDGRDIGTVVFPNADLKIFLTADISARAARRYKEMKEKGYEPDIKVLEKEIEARDKYDSSREASPLKQADDAIEIDTSNMSLQEQSNYIIGLAKAKIDEVNGTDKLEINK